MRKLKKKPAKKPIRKARPTEAQLLDNLRRQYPRLVTTIRDHRAVIHWPATLEMLADKKDALPMQFGVAYGEEANEFIESMTQAACAASQWPICSCGSLCRAIPRQKSFSSKYGAPQDTELRSLGADFYERLKRGEIASAVDTMEAIERRATVLLRRMGKKKVAYS